MRPYRGGSLIQSEALSYPQRIDWTRPRMGVGQVRVAGPPSSSCERTEARCDVSGSHLLVPRRCGVQPDRHIAPCRRDSSLGNILVGVNNASRS